METLILINKKKVIPAIMDYNNNFEFAERLGKKT